MKPTKESPVKSGARYGNWTIVREYPPSYYGKRQVMVRFAVCKCDCGYRGIVKYQNLMTGRSQSCGCKYGRTRRGRPRQSYKVDGVNEETLRALGVRYRDMINRCYDPKSINYARYGGRGVLVCEDWSISFQSFVHWALQSGFSPELQIDRIDNDGHYSPQNCRFVGRQENCQNRFTTRLSAADIGPIKKLRESGRSYGEIAMHYCVSRSAIYKVCKGMTWGNINSDRRRDG